MRVEGRKQVDVHNNEVLWVDELRKARKTNRERKDVALL
jgi:hypothetical protein